MPGCPVGSFHHQRIKRRPDGDTLRALRRRLDIHKKTVVACLLTPGPRGQTTKTMQTFGTLTADLLALAEWLQATGCTHVAMESTGVFWKPIYNLLEGTFTLLLVNAQHLKTVPGRKMDVKDAEWIAELLQHGLLRASFYSRSGPPGAARADALSYRLDPGAIR